jgi:hypothetical protein
MSLCDIANKYGTDKCPTHRGLRPGHSYTPFYEHIFKHLKVRSLLEIGIERGASLRMWRDYFPEAEIRGLDIDSANLITEERIQSALWDATVKFDWLGVNYDIIIDDGSHRADDQIKAFHNLFSILSPNGIYVIEDVPETNAEYVQAGLGVPSLRVDFRPDFPSKDDRIIVVTK